MKKLAMMILAFAVICSLGLTGIVSCSSLGHADMVDNYQSMDDLIKDSPIIVIGTVNSENKELEYGHMTFALTEFTVETTIRGSVPETITILQTKIYEDPYIKTGDRMVLFLVKYTGPVAEDAYRMKGLYQGQYKVDGTRVVKNSDNKLTGDEILESLDSMKSRIDTVEYAPVNHNALSTE